MPEDDSGGVVSWIGKSVDEALEIEHRDPIIEFLLDEKTRYRDELLPDLRFYVTQNHTVLSIFCSHPLHPYSRFFRTVVLAANLCFSFFVSACAGYLMHIKSDWSGVVNYFAGPLWIIFMTKMLVFFATCDPAQRNGTRRIYRWGCTLLGYAVFTSCWCSLVPTFLALGLSFASYRSSDDILSGGIDNMTQFRLLDFGKIEHDFHPSWHLFLNWLEQTAVELAAEIPILLGLFYYTRNYSEEETQCLVDRREQWRNEHQLLVE